MNKVCKKVLNIHHTTVKRNTALSVNTFFITSESNIPEGNGCEGMAPS